MVKLPGFVKFYQPSLAQHNSKIPTKFIQSIRGNFPENVLLRDGSNNLWRVRVEMTNGYYYFKDGWTKFVDDNKVEEGDLIVYEYFSHGILDFKIHEQISHCSTKRAVDLTTKIQHDDGGDCIPSNVEESQKFDYFEAEEVTDTDDDEAAIPVSEENDEDATKEKDRKRTRNSTQRGKVGDGGASSSTKKGKRDLDWYGEELFQFGFAQQPNNPYFVTKKRKNRPYELFVPAEVIKVYNLNLPETIMLVDHKERKFPISRKKWSNGRTLISTAEVGQITLWAMIMLAFVSSYMKLALIYSSALPLFHPKGTNHSTFTFFVYMLVFIVL